MWEPFEFEGTEGSSGAKVCTLLDDAFGQLSQWWVHNAPLNHCVVGQAPLINGAEISRTPSPALETGHAIAFLEVLHGPDAGIRFSLHRGVYSLGKFQCDLTIADDALSPVHGNLHVLESGFQWQTQHKTEQLKAQEKFVAGDTTLVISTQPAVSASHSISLAPIQVDVVPPRSLLLTVTMMSVPVVAGLLISWLTHNWLFMLMSLVTTLVMGTHLVVQGGSSKKTRRAIAQAAEKEQSSVAGFPSLVDVVQGAASESCQYFSLGIHERPANLCGRNIEHYKLPYHRAISCLLPLDQGLTYMLNINKSVQRSILAQITCATQHSIAIDENLLNRSPELFSLIGVRNVTVFSPEHEKEIDADILWVSSGQPFVKSGQQCVFTVCSESHNPRIAPDVDIVVTSQVNNPRMSIQQISKQEEILVPGLSAETSLDVIPDGISSSTFQRAVHQMVQRSGAFSHEQPRNPHGMQHHFSSLIHLATETCQLRWNHTQYEDELQLHLGLGCETINATLHGPHFLIGGTTGAGKSQLLRSLLLSLAAQYSPERCSFLLVDFKGSAGLGPLDALPHSLGLLSDFDIASVKRALAFLTANLKQREILFASLGISSYRDYVRVQQKNQTPLEFSEIFIVVDEFKMLVESMPEAMNELLKVATIGRSLGVHLILATQRPQGAISQDIRANIATTIALRVASEQDSHNLIGAPTAAFIASSTPGAGYIKTPESGLRPFQAPLIDKAPLLDEVMPSLTNLRTKARLPKISHHFEHEDEILQQIVASYTKGIKSYDPQTIVPSPLPKLLQPNHHEFATPKVYLGMHENPALGFTGDLVWDSVVHGSLHLVGDSTVRQDVELSIVSQWAKQGKSCFIFTSDGNFYRQLISINSSIAACTFGLQDLDFIHEIINHLLSQDTSSNGILFDGLDVLLEETMRLPDMQLKILQLLQDGHRSGTSLVTSSHLPLRGKFATAVSNTAIYESSYIQDLSIIKPRTEIPPLPYQWKVLGELAREVIPSDPRSNAVLMGLGKREIPPLTPVISQLPVTISQQEMPPALSVSQKDLLIGIDKNSNPLYIRNTGSKFFCISGKKSSGKTSTLRAIIALNPHREFIMVKGSKIPGATALEKMLVGIPHPEQKILLVDEMQVLDARCQNVLVDASNLFDQIFIAFTPWKRWHSSPLLSKLAGTSKGLILQPDSVSDLEIFTVGDLPLNLRTDGVLPAGRAVYVESSVAHACQVAWCTPVSGFVQEEEGCC